MKRVVSVLLLVGSALSASVARAQTLTVPHDPSFEIDRLTPAPGPGTFWQVEDGDLARAGERAFGVVTSFSANPLVVRDITDGHTLSTPVSSHWGADLLAALGVADAWQLGVGLPFVLYQDGDRLQGLGIPGGEEPLRHVTIGDLRLHGKARLLEAVHGYGWGAAANLVVTLPTGDQSAFAGEKSVVVEARGAASLRRERWELAANLGLRIRFKKVEFLSPEITLGNELTYGVAGSYLLPFGHARWSAAGEIAGAFGLGEGPSPSEARAGLRWRIVPTVEVGVALGAGIGDTRAIGTPGWRAIVELRWDLSPHADADGDGIPDAVDKCPFEPEDFDGFQDSDGCPDPDNDGDGIPDTIDQCPNEPEDFDNYRDWDGCPDPDNDGDGIPDVVDKCPNEPEDFDGFQDADGCPDLDNDGDGIPDALDKCPNEPEDLDGWQDADGCPDLDNDGDGIPDVLDKCPDQPEDKDGWQDADGCPDLDDDRDGVPDALDRCPEAPETITSPSDLEQDGCPDGEPMARALPDGTIALTANARAALKFAPGDDKLSPAAAMVVTAIARAVHRAGWDEAPGDALVISIPGDGPDWSAVALHRSEAVAAKLKTEGVRAGIEAHLHPRGMVFRGEPAAVVVGKGVKIKGKRLPSGY